MTKTTPPIAKHVDLRDFAFMPLDVQRLRDSDIAMIDDGEAFRCAVLLWCAAWHQIPAGSLPNSDAALARYAGLGRDRDTWERVKEDAMHGFFECDDGRLYHPVVCEKALDAWKLKEKQRGRTKNATEARRNRNDDRNDDRNDSRNVHQGTGTGNREPRSEGVITSSARAREGYAFEGTVVRLTRKDLDRWRKTFVNIPNLEALLESRDAWLTENPDRHKNWFQSTSAWLANKDAEFARARPDDGEDLTPTPEEEIEIKRRLASGEWGGKAARGSGLDEYDRLGDAMPEFLRRP